MNAFLNMIIRAIGTLIAYTLLLKVYNCCFFKFSSSNFFFIDYLNSLPLNSEMRKLADESLYAQMSTSKRKNLLQSQEYVNFVHYLRTEVDKRSLQSELDKINSHGSANITSTVGEDSSYNEADIG